MTIRLRLTAWYALALAAALALFATAIWLSMRASLVTSLDAAMADHAHSLARFLEHEFAPTRPLDLTDELGEFSQGLPPGTSVEIREPDNRILFSSGPLQSGPSRSTTATTWIQGQPYGITVTTSLASANDTLRRLAFLLAIVTPVIMLIAISGAYWLSRRALGPVTALISAAQSISIDNLSRRLEVPQTGDELQLLSETWNAVLARLEAAVNRISQFTADASHELRTPLAVIRATAELAARKSRSPETYRAALQEVVAESDRMTRLVEELLFLARCDANELALQLVDLAEIAQEACAVIAPLSALKQLNFSTTIEPTYIAANPLAMRRLILVLLDNAIKFTPNDGTVELRLDSNRLIVSDTGFGIDPEKLPHIFERFYQADPARSHTGHGLGLAQAQSIATRHNALIRVTSRLGQGSVFEVTFPPCPSQPIQTARNISSPSVTGLERNIA